MIKIKFTHYMKYYSINGAVNTKLVPKIQLIYLKVDKVNDIYPYFCTTKIVHLLNKNIYIKSEIYENSN